MIFSFTKVFICSRSTKENQNKVWYFWNYFTTLFKAEICRTTWAERSIHQKHDWSKLHAILNHRNTSASFCCMYYKCNAAQAYLSQQDHFFLFKFVLKFWYSEKATIFKKNSRCYHGRFFLILWPSQNIWTLFKVGYIS